MKGTQSLVSLSEVKRMSNQHGRVVQRLHGMKTKNWSLGWQTQQIHWWLPREMSETQGLRFKG